jgi:hypothetical protein
MYPNPALEVALAQERRANKRFSPARAQSIKRHHTKSASLTALLSLLFG